MDATINWFERMKTISIEQASLKPEQELSEMVICQLHTLTEASFVTFSEYIKKEACFLTRKIHAEQKLLELGFRMLGEHFSDVKAKANPAFLQERIKNPLMVAASLAEASAGYISDEMSEALHRVSGVDRLVVMTHVMEGEVYGLSVAGFQPSKVIPPLEVLEFFSSITALSIRRRQAEIMLQEASHRYREIVSSAQEGIVVLDSSLRITEWNACLAKMSGIPAERVMGKTPGETMPWLVEMGIVERMKRALSGESLLEADLRLPDDEQGNPRWAADSYGPLRDASGAVIGVIGTIHDISHRKASEEQLRYMGMHDMLTGLANRHRFDLEIERLQKSRDFPVTIMSFDMDGLKMTNDMLGYEGGDEALRACADMLRTSMREGDILARVGGDEYAAVFPCMDSHHAEIVAERIRQTLAEEANHSRILPISLSMGIATASDRRHMLTYTFRTAEEHMVREKLVRKRSTRSQIIDSLLAALYERDYETEGHSMRLARHCLAIGRRIGLSSDRLNSLELLTRVHDLGKVGIPDAILLKAGPLTEEEWVIMRQHPERGFRIADASPDLAGVADLILKHHERWDGTGYQLLLKGEEIPLECRILGVVDAYDAMTNNRPYRKAMPHEDAVEELHRNAGTQFDPHVVRVFLEELNRLEEEIVFTS